MTTLGTPGFANATRLLLLGSGELVLKGTYKADGAPA